MAEETTEEVRIIKYFFGSCLGHSRTTGSANLLLSDLKTLRVEVEVGDLKQDSYISHGIFFAFRFPIFALDRHKLEDDVWLLVEVKEVVGGEGVLVVQGQTLVHQPHPVGGNLHIDIHLA